MKGMCKWVSRASKSDLVRKISATFATQILRLLMSFAASVIVARILGPTNRGLFALALATGTLGVQFANLGLHTANTYFAARDQNSLPSLLGNTLVVSLGFGTAVSVALWGVFHYGGLIYLKGGILLLALLWIPIGLAYLLGQNLLLGIQRIAFFNSAEIINRALPLALVVLLLLLRLRTVEAMFGAMLAGLTGSCFYVFYRLRQQCKSSLVISFEFMRKNFNYAAKAYLAALFCFLVVRSDLFLVQRFIGIQEAGYYSVAVTLAETLSLLPATIGMILFPRLSEYQILHSKLQLTWKASITTAAILLPTFVLAGLFSRYIIVGLFGHAFERSFWPFVLLLPGIFFLGLHS